MKITSTTERVVYVLVILLALVILALVAKSPVDFLNTEAVYKGL